METKIMIMGLLAAVFLFGGVLWAGGLDGLVPEAAYDYDDYYGYGDYGDSSSCCCGPAVVMFALASAAALMFRERR